MRNSLLRNLAVASALLIGILHANDTQAHDNRSVYMVLFLTLLLVLMVVKLSELFPR